MQGSGTSVGVTGSGIGDVAGEDHSTLDNLGFDESGHEGFRQAYSGFVNKTEDGTLFFDLDGSVGHQSTPRTFYIYGDFTYQIKGVPTTKSLLIGAADYIQISNVSGVHYIYYDENGDLQETTSLNWETILYDNAYVAVVYWNATNSELVYCGDERHGPGWDWELHVYEHIYERTRYTSGLGLTIEDIDGSGADASAARLLVTNGAIADEDIAHTIADDTPQDLSPIAQIPVLYRSGATEWRFKAADNYPLIYSDGVVFTGANGIIPYNDINGGNWQLTEVADGKFTLVHYMATNDISHPIIGMQGQAEYNSIAAARLGATTELGSIILAGLPFQEFKFIATVIFQTDISYTNAPAARTRSLSATEDYIDWRTEEITPIGVPSAVDHAALANLDYASAGHTGFEPTVTDGDFTAVTPLSLSATRQLRGGAAAISLDSAYVPRERLSADRTYYVRTDGSDSNDGLTDSAGGAFLTIQHAINVYQDEIDCNGYNVVIQVGNGTYTDGATILSRVGAGNLYIYGDISTPDNVFLNCSSTIFNVFGHPAGSSVTIRGFKMATSSGTGIYVGRYAYMAYGNINFSTIAGYNVYCASGAYAIWNWDIEISGNTTVHVYAALQGIIATGGGLTCTLTGTPTISYFAYASRAGSIEYSSGTTFSGSCTGQRYVSLLNSVINTNGGGASFFPGTVAGSTATGGQYG